MEGLKRDAFLGLMAEPRGGSSFLADRTAYEDRRFLTELLLTYVLLPALFLPAFDEISSRDASTEFFFLESESAFEGDFRALARLFGDALAVVWHVVGW